MDDELIKYALGEFAAGRGVEMSVPTDTGLRRLVLIPSVLYKASTVIELLIAFEGAGVFFYDGSFPLNAFKLISHGFPYAVAEQVAELIRALMPCRDRRRTPLLLGAPTKNKTGKKPSQPKKAKSNDNSAAASKVPPSTRPRTRRGNTAASPRKPKRISRMVKEGRKHLERGGQGRGAKGQTGRNAKGGPR